MVAILPPTLVSGISWPLQWHTKHCWSLLTLARLQAPITHRPDGLWPYVYQLHTLPALGGGW